MTYDVSFHPNPPISQIERVHTINAMDHSSRSEDALTYCYFGDALGAGIEMKSRNEIITLWDRICKELVYERTNQYAIGLDKGWYTDDTEMSLGVIKALHSERFLSPDLVVQCLLDVYDDFKRENGGTGRGGYGGFRFLASMENVNRVEELKERRPKETFRNGMPGNGAGMRVLPVLTHAKEYYPHDVEAILHNIIVQTIATHNHACAALSSIVYIDVADALIEGNISFEETLDFAFDFFARTGKYSHLLPSPEKCLQTMNEIGRKYEVPIFGNWNEFASSFQEHLKVMDGLDGPADEVGTNIDFDRILSQKLRGDEVGVPVRADDTLFAALYCLKWTMTDFNRSKGDIKESYFSLMKRGLSFGGDVDTLLAHVVPVSFLRLKDENGAFDLPDWLLNSYVEKDDLMKRLEKARAH